jgi:hypothetical protein
MQLHELIDIINPVCLYCNNKCIESGVGYIESLSTIIFDCFICSVCNEHFKIEMLHDAVCGFIFTCDEFSVYQDYNNNSFGINKSANDINESNMSAARTKTILVPEFFINFSDKQALLNKLKIFLTFS